MPSAPRMSKRLSQAPRMSIIMAGDDPQERKHEASVREICADHVKTIVTLFMIFGTIACIVVIVLIHKWHYEESRAEEVEACLDVAVIGAGVSGSYAAWRMRHDAKAKIHLFELTDGAGGRFRTEHFPEYDNRKMKAELGAMYYFPQRHQLLNRTIHALKLTPEGYYPPNQDPPIYYFRGTHLRRTDFRAPNRYNLETHEKDKTPEELKRYYTEMYLSKNIHDNPLLEKYNDFVNLYEMGYWNFLNNVASREGFSFIQDGAPWRSHVSNGNAALLASLDLNTWDQHSTLVEGMQELPKRLARQFENSTDKHLIHYNRQLVCIQREEWQQGLYYTLIFQLTETIDGITYKITKSERYCANKVILAVSPAMVKRIRFIGFNQEADHLPERIDSALEAVPAMTAYLMFNESWWRGTKPGFEDVITDLPLRRTRYVGSGRRRSRDGGVEYGHLFMAANPDLVEVSYFDPLLKYGHGSVIRNECNITRQGFLDMKRQFARAQGISVHSLPDPIHAYIADWRDSPTYAGWHMWKVGIRWDKEAARLRRPLTNEHIYLIGSDLCPGNCQLWAEGAIQTAESLLETYFPKYHVAPLDRPSRWHDDGNTTEELTFPIYD